MTPDYFLTIIITLLGWLFSVIAVAWTVGRKYGELENKVEKNSQDINNVAQKMRSSIRVSDYLLQSQISHLQEHLMKKDGYSPPTLNTFEDR